MTTPAEAREAAQRFSTDDLRDLQVWQKLAWLDPFYLDGDARVRALIAKGRLFSEEDKLLLRDIELELLNAVIPEYREAAARGQVELSTSPFYHPILPLAVRHATSTSGPTRTRRCRGGRSVTRRTRSSS